MPYRTHRPVVMGINWMITADHPLAAQAGAGVLESGGNAVDAAVAVNLVMAVVRPHMCGLGGDLFALIYKGDTGRLEALNASGRAPGRANPEFYQSKGYVTMPESGILTATVPGAIHGWQEALERHGTLSLDRLLAKAVEYAEKGFPVYGELRRAIEEKKDLLIQSSNAAKTFLPGGNIPGIGDRLLQPDLAESLRKLAAQGPDVLYRGELGQALVALSKASGGLFSEEDLAEQTSTWLEPLRTGYRGYEICTQPPNSQGIALLIQANILEHFDLKSFGPDSADLIHFMVEAKKSAFADRDRYVCDPDFHPVPTAKMLSKAHARDRAARIDPDRAAGEVMPADFTAGGEDTIYLAVVDGEGNAVSMIQSLYEAFGSCVMVPGTGIMLHNRGRGFSLDPEHVNRLEPGKRPYHTLHPAMVLKDGRPHIVLGSPGADGQTQTVIQMLVRILEFGADVQETVEAPRWRSMPEGTLLMEGRFPSEVINELESRGHQVERRPAWDDIMGSAQAIRIDRERGVLSGGADPRRQAYAIGS